VLLHLNVGSLLDGLHDLVDVFIFKYDYLTVVPWYSVVLSNPLSLGANDLRPDFVDVMYVPMLVDLLEKHRMLL